MKKILMDKAGSIAALNDKFRLVTSKYMLTNGIRSLTNLDVLIDYIALYSAFNEDNDPYGEHDFGSLEWKGEKVFWKIDYYNQALSGWCDPLSPDCKRVITVMLAEEY
jgi:hypothetical protein